MARFWRWYCWPSSQMKWANGSFWIRRSVVFWYRHISSRATVPGQCHWDLCLLVMALGCFSSSSPWPTSEEGLFLYLGADFFCCALSFPCQSLTSSLPVFNFFDIGPLVGLGGCFWPFPEESACFLQTFCNEIMPWYSNNAWCMLSITLFKCAMISGYLQQVHVII